MKPIKEGKVREVYDNGDSIIMVATDRISAFDVILKNKIVNKGAVLTQMSKFWFELTKDIVPNHMLSTDVNDMPEFFRNEEYKGKSMMCKKLTMLPIECIVRGLYWNRYGTPEKVLDQFNREDAIPVYWWVDPVKSAALDKAMKSGESLPIPEYDIR